MLKFPIYKLRINDDDLDTGVDFVALVDEPAIEKNFMAFTSDKDLFQVKDKEQRIVSGALMVANLPIYRRDEQHGEYYVVFDKETIGQIVHKFFRNKFTTNVNLMHDPSKKAEDIYMFESFIIDRSKGVNPPIGFEKLSDGSWFGSFKVNNEEVWNQIKAGEFKGFSVEGIFKHEYERDSDTHLIDNLREVLLRELNKETNNVIYNKDPKIMELNINEKIKEKLSAIKALFTEEVEVKMTDAKLKDGVTIVSYEGETPVEGAKIFVVDESGKNPAPDGEHTLEDGTVLTVQGGIIVSVKAVEVEEEAASEVPVVEVVNNEAVEALKKENEDLKVELSKVKNSFELLSKEVKEGFKKLNEYNKGLFEVVEGITNIPDAEPIKKPTTPFVKGDDRNKKLIELSKNLQTIKK